MKNILIILFVLFNLQVQANETSFFDNTNDIGNVGDPDNGSGIGIVDDPDPAPIDDYIYVLAGIATGIGFYYNRKSLLITK